MLFGAWSWWRGSSYGSGGTVIKELRAERWWVDLVETKGFTQKQFSIVKGQTSGKVVNRRGRSTGRASLGPECGGCLQYVSGKRAKMIWNLYPKQGVYGVTAPPHLLKVGKANSEQQVNLINIFYFHFFFFSCGKARHPVTAAVASNYAWCFPKALSSTWVRLTPVALNNTV